MRASISRTRTEHELPFDRLSPRDFERLCLALVEREGYENVEHFGAAGGDSGRDLLATRQGRRIVFQCKRQRSFVPSEAEAEVAKVLDLSLEERPTELVFLVACDISANTRRRAQVKGGDTLKVSFWALTDLDNRVQRYPELLERFFGLLPDTCPISSVGAIGLPPKLPPHYRERSSYLEALKLALQTTSGSRLAVTGVGTLGIQGMGGIGKSVLAAAVAQESEVLSTFPDGIYWVTVGREANREALLRDLASAIGAPSPTSHSIASMKDAIRNHLNDKRTLLILDDVWTREDAEALDVTGPFGRLLLTTRNAGILDSFGAQELCVDVLEESEALTLLSSWAGERGPALSPAARCVVEECGFLPLAVAMAGALARKLDSWDDVLDHLRRANLERLETLFPGYPYPNLLRSLEASVEFLAIRDQARYFELAVFPEDAAIPEPAVVVLWSAAQIFESEARELLTTFSDLSLIRRDSEGRLTLHDLQRDYICKRVGDLPALHRRLVRAYAICSPDGFASGLDDGWFFQRLPWHLAEGGMVTDLHTLLFSFSWLQAKLSAVGINSLISDFDLLPEEPASRKLQATLRLSAHAVNRDSTQFAGQLLGRLANDCGTPISAILANARTSQSCPWLRPLRPTLTPPGPLIRAFDIGLGPCVAMSMLDQRRIALAKTDQVIILDFITGETSTHYLKFEEPEHDILAQLPRSPRPRGRDLGIKGA